MQNNFNLSGYLKKNTLMEAFEGFGGYADLKPLKEMNFDEMMGTAMDEDMDAVNALVQKWKDDPSSDPEYKSKLNKNAGDYNQAQADAQDWFDEYEAEGRLDDFYGMSVEELIDALETFGADNAAEVAPILHKMINQADGETMNELEKPENIYADDEDDSAEQTNFDRAYGLYGMQIMKVVHEMINEESYEPEDAVQFLRDMADKLEEGDLS